MIQKQEVENEVDKGNNKVSVPEFGDENTPIDDVLYFYNYYENFVTNLTFASEDKYDTREAPNRQVKR